MGKININEQMKGKNRILFWKPCDDLFIQSGWLPHNTKSIVSVL